MIDEFSAGFELTAGSVAGVDPVAPVIGPAGS